MGSDIQSLLASAIASLELQDIVLYQNRLKRGNPFPDDPDSVSLQTRKEAYFIGEGLSDPSFVNGDQPMLVAGASLGVRVVRNSQNDGESESAEVFVEIEADFILDYAITDKTVSREALEKFVEVNVLHNIWPFWRQHVYDVRQRALLPQINIGFFPPTAVQGES